MKSSSLLPACLLGISLFFIVSCGNQADNKDTEAGDSTATDTSTTVAATTEDAIGVPKIVTTPQAMMFTVYKVADYDKWQTSYEEHDTIRRNNGAHDYVIGFSTADRNKIFIALKLDDIEKGKSFAKSQDLKQAIRKAGVIGAAEINVYNITWQDTGKTSTNLRSKTTFRVKDWDRWQRAFDSTRPIRIANGLADRAYGHDATDNKKVTVVVAVTDTTKAYAFWKSDQLKALRANSGAIGQPERFNFRIVKRY